MMTTTGPDTVPTTHKHKRSKHEAMFVEKPLADVQRKRYDPSLKHKGLNGHTGRRGCGCQDCRAQLTNQAELKRDHNATLSNAKTFRYLEDDSTYAVTVPMSRLTEPYSLTMFELNGHEVSHSLHRASTWDTIPATLSEYSVGPPVARKRADGKIDNTFMLEATAAFMPDPAVAAAVHDLKTRIYTVQRHRPRLWASLLLEPPEGVRGELLKPSLRCVGSRVPQAAVVRCNQPHSAWDVSRANGRPLDIDLGRTMEITDFSTQGRHPPTRRYPHCWKADDHMWRVEDAEYGLPGVEYSANGHQTFKGPPLMVKCTAGDLKKEGTSRTFRDEWCQAQYVARYELLWRADGGRVWHSCGVFNGNTDSITEVSHSFAIIHGGLRARYLRLVPLDWQNGGAVRVGVYGHAVEGASAGKRVRGGTKRTEEEDQLVAYTLTTSPQNRSTTFAFDGQALAGGGKDSYGRTKQSTVRLRRQLQAREELARYRQAKGRRES